MGKKGNELVLPLLYEILLVTIRFFLKVKLYNQWAIHTRLENTCWEHHQEMFLEIWDFYFVSPQKNPTIMHSNSIIPKGIYCGLRFSIFSYLNMFKSDIRPSYVFAWWGMLVLPKDSMSIWNMSSEYTEEHIMINPLHRNTMNSPPELHFDFEVLCCWNHDALIHCGYNKRTLHKGQMDIGSKLMYMILCVRFVLFIAALPLDICLH